MTERAIHLNRGAPEWTRSLSRWIGEVAARPYLIPLVLGCLPLALVVVLSLLVFYTTFVPRLPTTM